MASIEKRGTKFRVSICVNGVRKTATTSTKAEAKAWAEEMERKLRLNKGRHVPADKTFGDLLIKYADEKSVEKKTATAETFRIVNIVKTQPIAKVLLTHLDETHVAAWRDARRKEVSDATVRREWTIMSHACTVARKEWKWLHDNPFFNVSRPDTPPARDRRFEGDELERLLVALGCDPHGIPKTESAKVGFAVLFAIETALRCGEICALEWRDIISRRAIVRGEDPGAGKSGRREVPLSKEALRLLTLLPSAQEDGEDTAKVFDLRPQQVDALFRKARDKALITNLHFHDTRAEALTRMSKKVEVLTLAKISGHRDLKILLNTYYRESMEAVADLLG